MLESSRLVEVFHDRGPALRPRWLLGSGFVVGNRMVITAAHNLGDPHDDNGTIVRTLRGEQCDADVLVRSDTVDLALLRVADIGAQTMPLARLNRDGSIVQNVMVAGFPAYKVADDLPGLKRADLAQLVGTVATLEDFRAGLLTLKLRDGMPMAADRVGESPWQGLSGGGVVVGDSLIGVAIAHYVKEGTGAIRVAPLTRIAEAAASDRAQFLQLLDVGDVDDLPVVSPPDEGRAPEGIAAPELPPPSNLPADVDLVGRDGELAWLETALTQAEEGRTAPAVAALTGRGGVGKSALAIHAAYRLRAQFPAGQLYVDLRGGEAGAVDPSDVLEGFLRRLGLSGIAIPDGLADRSSEYREHLRGRQMLVVLDNATSSAQIKPLLPASAENAVIVTSREALPELAGQPACAIDVLRVDRALDLLAHVAGDGAIAADVASGRAVAEYCGYLPLALRIAGARLASSRRSVKSLAAELADERERLSGLSMNDEDIRACFGLSYSTLSVDERTAFRRLGLLYSNDFTRWRLAALMDRSLTDADRILWRLVEAQLVDFWRDDVAEQARFRLSSLLRVYARELAEQEEPADAQRAALARAGDASLTFARFAADALEPGQQRAPDAASERWEISDPALLRAIAADPTQWFSSERGSVLSATQRLHDAELWDLCWRLAEALVGFFDLHTYWDDWEKTHELALAAARRAQDSVGEAVTLRHLGRLYRYQGRFEDAARCLYESREIFRALEDRGGEAATLVDLIRLEWFTGARDQAVNDYTRACRLVEDLDDRHLKGRLLNSVALVEYGRGNWKRARDAFRDSVDVFEHFGDRRWIAASMWGLGMVCRDLGAWDDALAQLQRALPLLGQVGNRRWQGVTLRSIGDVHRDRGQWTAAEDALRNGLAILDEVRDPFWRPHLLVSLAAVYRATGRHPEALACLEEALAANGEHTNALALLRRAEIDVDRRELAAAHADLDTATAFFARIGERLALGEALLTRGRAHALGGRDDEAQTAWSEALQCFEHLGSWKAGEARDLLEAGSEAGEPARALTPDMRAFLAELGRQGGQPLDALTPAQARAQPGFDEAIGGLLQRRGRQRMREPVAAIEELALNDRTAEVPALLYRPIAVGPLPVVLFLHGGGWVLDDQPSYDAVMRRIATATPCLAVYVRYRLAPEHPFPAALEDTCTALRWAQNRSGEVGGDPARIAFVGQSAGGNLAVATCLKVLEEGCPLPSFQSLVYPVLDRRFDRPSYLRYEEAPGLSAREMRWFWEQYAGSDGTDPLASPLLADDLSALPATQVMTAEVDPLHDEGREFASRLRSAGVEVLDQPVAGVTHGFFALVEFLPEAAMACASVTSELRRHFTAPPERTR